MIMKILPKPTQTDIKEIFGEKDVGCNEDLKFGLYNHNRKISDLDGSCGC